MKYIKPYLKVQYLVELVVVLYSASSVFNISQYILLAEGNVYTAVAAGLSIGLSVIATALVVSRIEPSHQSRVSFTIAIIAMTLTIALSGYIQYSLYSLHNSTMDAIWLGILAPLFMEAGLVLNSSFYSAYQKQSIIRDSQTTVHDNIAVAISESLQDIDVGTIQRQAEKAVSRIVQHQLDQVLASYIGEPVSTPAPTIPPKAKLQVDTTPTNEMRQTSTKVRGNKKQIALDATVEFFEANPSATLEEAGGYVGKGKSTMSGYVNELKAQGRL